MSGGGLGGVFTGGATQQAQPFGFAPAAVNTFGAPQVTYISKRLVTVQLQFFDCT